MRCQVSVSGWIANADQGGKAVWVNHVLRILETPAGHPVPYSNKQHRCTPKLPMNNKPSSRIENLLFSQQRPKIERGWLQTYFGCDPCVKAWALVGIHRTMSVDEMANVHISSASTGKGRKIQKWSTTSDLKLYGLQVSTKPTSRQMCAKHLQKQRTTVSELQLKTNWSHRQHSSNSTAWQSSFPAFPHLSLWTGTSALVTLDQAVAQLHLGVCEKYTICLWFHRDSCSRNHNRGDSF